MSVQLIRANINDTENIWKMQVEAFSKLYEKYQDTETCPATEPLEKVMARLQQPFTYYYFIEYDGIVTGAMRVVDKKEAGVAKRISLIFVMDRYRGCGIAQAAILEAERIHGSIGWELDTILEEAGNCYLYEKMGYHRTGEIKRVNDRLTLVFYEKK